VSVPAFSRRDFILDQHIPDWLQPRRSNYGVRFICQSDPVLAQAAGVDHLHRFQIQRTIFQFAAVVARFLLFVIAP